MHWLSKKDQKWIEQNFTKIDFKNLKELRIYTYDKFEELYRSIPIVEDRFALGGRTLKDTPEGLFRFLSWFYASLKVLSYIDAYGENPDKEKLIENLKQKILRLTQPEGESKEEKHSYDIAYGDLYRVCEKNIAQYYRDLVQQKGLL